MGKITFFVISVFAFFCFSLNASPVTTPGDLNIGDEYRLVFVTSTVRQSLYLDDEIADYDAFVNAAASTQSELSGISWKTIGSTNTINAIDHTNTNTAVDGAGVPIYLLDGTTKIADNNFDLWDGTIDAPINIDETGNLVSGTPFVWTGSHTNGVVFPGERGLGGAVIPMAGDSTGTGSNWIRYSPMGHTNQYHIYGMSEILTVQAVPEPSTYALMALGFIGLAFYRKKI